MSYMFANYNHVPIAIILGSDNKPLRVRYFGSEFIGARTDTEGREHNYIFDKWATEPGNSVISGYKWLPIINSSGKIVRDGVILIKAYDYSVYKPDGKYPSVYLAVDARANSRCYTPSEILKLINRDINHRVFCNVDYSVTDKVAILSSIAKNNTIKLTDLSSDFEATSNIFALAGYENCFKTFSVDGTNLVRCSANFFNQDVVILPDCWGAAYCNIGVMSTLSTLVVPNSYTWFRIDTGFNKTLKTLVLPDTKAVKYCRSTSVVLLHGAPSRKYTVLIDGKDVFPQLRHYFGSYRLMLFDGKYVTQERTNGFEQYKPIII